MRYFKDVKGKNPAKPGDKVALAKSSIDEIFKASKELLNDHRPRQFHRHRIVKSS